MTGIVKTFGELGIARTTGHTVAELGHEQPTPFQAPAVRALSEKRDLCQPRLKTNPFSPVEN